jgi:hypothetical protein
MGQPNEISYLPIRQNTGFVEVVRTCLDYGMWRCATSIQSLFRYGPCLEDIRLKSVLSARRISAWRVVITAVDTLGNSTVAFNLPAAAVEACPIDPVLTIHSWFAWWLGSVLQQSGNCDFGGFSRSRGIWVRHVECRFTGVYAGAAQWASCREDRGRSTSAGGLSF